MDPIETGPASPTAPANPKDTTQAKDMRHAAVGAGTNFLTILAGVSEVVFHPVMANLYGTVAYGLYRLGFSTIEPFLRLSPLGSDKGLLRYISSHRVANEQDLERSSLRTAFWLTLIGSMLLGLLAFAVAGPLAALQDKPETVTAIRLLAPNLPFAALVVVLISATMGAKFMRFNLLVRGIAQPLLLLLISLCTWFAAPTLAGLCASHLMASAITAALALWAVSRVFKGKPVRKVLFSRSEQGSFFHWEMVRFSFPMGVAEFLNALLQRADQILLGIFAGAEKVAIYAGAEALSRVISNVRYAFDPVASPVLSEALRQNDQRRLRYNLQLMTRWTTLFTFPVAIFLVNFRVELLQLFPEAFVTASTVFIVLSAGHLINGTLGLCGWVIAMSGRSKLVLLNNLLAALANIGLCLLLLPRYGIMGAAISSASSVAIIQVLQVVESALLARVHPFSFSLLKVAVAGFVTAGVTIQVTSWLDGSIPIRLTIGLLVMLLAYGTLLLAFGLPKEEREIATKIWRKLRRAL